MLKSVRESCAGTFRGMTTEQVFQLIREEVITKREQMGTKVEDASADACDDSDDYDLCCVCQWPMRPAKEQLTSMETCSHQYHSECIRTWLKQNAACPLCKSYSLMPDEYPTLR